MAPDELLHRRIFLALGLAAIPMVTAGSAAEEGDSGGDTGYDVHCVEPEDHACPAEETLIGDRLPWNCEVASVHSDAVYEDGECCYEVTKHCGAIGCGCAHGRPLRVARKSVVAAVGSGGGWTSRRIVSLAGLDARRRGRLAHFWASVGVNEHASIASFQRAALELLAHGAPPRLVAGTLRGAQDEVRHARNAFALASQFAGARIGPGPLPVSGALPLAANLTELAVRTLEEGCIEETRSVAAACAMLAGTTDPGVRGVLRRIVADEIRHAALAWRTLRWAVETGGPDVRAAAARALSDWRPEAAGGHAPETALAAWGCVSDRRLSAAADAITAATIRPAFTALLKTAA